MSTPRPSHNRSKRLYRPLAIAALISAGILQPLLPVLAAGTAAGQGISNTATATYTDDNNNPFNATSNTVTITVAPVAGLTVKGTGITDSNGGALEANDAVVYNFDITNVGNATENIYVPTTPTSVGATVSSVTYAIFDPVAGTTTPVTPVNNIIAGVKADQVIKVVVNATVNSTGLTAGNPVSITLGNTAPNDNSPATQNVTTDVGAQDVRTVATTPATYAINKEASAYQFLAFASTVTPQAFTLIKKTATSVPGATPAGNDDIVTYNLNFSVLNSSPNGSYSPANLTGTNIKLDSSTQSKILVSDAIPAGTVLQSAPTAPSGWTTVYSTDSVDNTIPIISTASGSLPAASWTTATPPAGLNAVKRVGFVPTTATSITAGSAAVNFPISVVTSGLPVNGGKVDNIAQVYGQTANTTSLVVDESGDANSSNFNDDGTVGPAYNPATDTGKADPATQAIDTNGNNTGLGPKGEVTETTITGTVAAAADSIFNGPNGTPTAVGPTDSNDDFSNASTVPPANQSPTTPITTQAQIATVRNTVSNPGTSIIANVTVQPISTAQAEVSDGIATTGQYNSNISDATSLNRNAIPTGTKVTLTDLTSGTTNKPVVYIYNGTNFIIQPAVTSGANQTQGTPLSFGSLAPGAVANYSTTIELPLDGNAIYPLSSVAVPIVAFADDDVPAGPNAGFNNETTNNITVNRVYTGYMKLFKEARILDTDGTAVIQDWSSAATLTSQAAPKQYIEYRIGYQNISSAANGSGNVVLNAKNFTLIEDGTGTNNWANFTTHQQNTSSAPGTTVTYFNGASTIGTTDPANGTTVTKYQDFIPASIAPTVQGTFQFRRLVN